MPGEARAPQHGAPRRSQRFHSGAWIEPSRSLPVGGGRSPRARRAHVSAAEAAGLPRQRGRGEAGPRRQRSGTGTSSTPWDHPRPGPGPGGGRDAAAARADPAGPAGRTGPDRAGGDRAAEERAGPGRVGESGPDRPGAHSGDAEAIVWLLSRACPAAEQSVPAELRVPAGARSALLSRVCPLGFILFR